MEISMEHAAVVSVTTMEGVSHHCLRVGLVCPRDGGCHELADDPATFGRLEESATPELIE
jgi:hypothetical protein